MRRLSTVVALGLAQTLAWASTYYLPAMLAAPMARDLGVTVPTVFAAFSVALVVSASLGPQAGRAIDRLGGRPVLMATNLVFALGLTSLGFATGPVSLFAAWVILGIGMGSGLYEAAFAALVRLWGNDARGAITGVTLFAGFASTAGWPLSTYLEVHYGWRSACLAWAALHLCIGLPLNAVLPRAASPSEFTSEAPTADADSTHEPHAALRSTLVLAWVFATTWFISTAMATHLPRLLQAGGASVENAVLVGALIGPAQVGARLLEFGLLRRLHPLFSTRLAAALHPVGVVLIAIFGMPAAVLFGLLHGAGNGILTIAKGTLPLAVLGPQGYGHRQGVLMVPARIAQALAPWAFGLAVDVWGTGALAISAGLSTLALASLFFLSLEMRTTARQP
ncbi:MFS transporter [Mitsuaria sp. CC2]|uniref:MFS transporter n=1 Tax=Mitsuaria sp. CC2 TaxID=3029186 RepID=UPI003B8BD151